MYRLIHYFRTIFALLILCVIFLSTSAKAESDTLLIAMIFPQTGYAVSQDHFTMLNLSKLLIDDINACGGLLGKKVMLELIDNQSTPIGSKIAADIAVKKGVIGIITTSWSSFSIPISQHAQKHHIPTLHAVATNPSITSIGDYIFRICFNDRFQGKLLAQFARQDLKARNAILLKNVMSDYSIALADEFHNNFTKLGGLVFCTLPYVQEVNSIEHIIQKIKEYKPEVIFLPGYKESGIIISQLQKSGLSNVIIGGDGWGTDDFIQAGGRDLVEGYYSDHWSKEMIQNSSDQFFKKHNIDYKNINALAALTYDALMLFFDAYKRAKSPTPDKIRDELAQTKNFHGITGTISFDSNRDPIKSAVIIKISHGHSSYFKTIKP